MLCVTSINDRVADRFLGLTLEQNDKAACRGFINALANVRADRSNLLATNTADFDLWLLGWFDEDCGYFHYENPDDDGRVPRLLMSGRTALKFLDSGLDVSEALQHPIEEFDDVFQPFDEEESEV